MMMKSIMVLLLNITHVWTDIWLHMTIEHTTSFHGQVCVVI